jgi:xanthine dehydrogenase accessory factor
MREILQELHRLLEESEPAGLATVIRTTGSAYRKEGAKMICRDGGRLIGSISGGCLEADVYERSMMVVDRNRTEIVEYDTNAENDNVWGLGIGCNGVVEVLIESLEWWRTATGREVFHELGNRVRDGRRCALVTIVHQDGIPLTSVKRILVDLEGATFGTFGDAALDEAAARTASAILREPKARSRRVRLDVGGVSTDAFVDAMVPPLRLIVFGAGHDALPMVRFGREVGMLVTVVDSRPQFTTENRFPDADRVVCVEAERVAEKVSFTGRPALVLMSHHYLKDLAVLRQIFESNEEFEYVGALGPRSRTERMLEELRAAGVEIRSPVLDVLRAPIGLDLGSESPAEIALSVIAEILAARNDRSSRPLRDKKGMIHAA